MPPELGNLSELETLSLYSNELTGGIPPELGNLTNLRELSLDGNQLSGEIPPELGNLANLERLVLYSKRVNRGNTAGVGQPDPLKRVGPRLEPVER